jgi:hypothetical protein
MKRMWTESQESIIHRFYSLTQKSRADHDGLSPITQWSFRCCQSPQICTAFEEIFLWLNSADQLKVEPSGQVTFTCPVPVGSIRQDKVQVNCTEKWIQCFRSSENETSWDLVPHEKGTSIWGYMYKASIFWYSMLTWDHWEFQLWIVIWHDSQEMEFVQRVKATIPSWWRYAVIAHMHDGLVSCTVKQYMNYRGLVHDVTASHLYTMGNNNLSAIPLHGLGQIILSTTCTITW